MNIEIWAYMNRHSDFHAPHLFEEYVSQAPIRPEVSKYKKSGDVAIAISKTARAVQLGIAIAAIDGPIPIGDAVGFGVAAIGTVRAWHEVLFD